MKINLPVLTNAPSAPPTGRMLFYMRGGIPRFMGSDGAERDIEDAADVMQTHLDDPDPHTQYMTQTEADALYAEVAHIHATGNLLRVSKVAQPGEYSTIAAALAFVNTQSPSATNRFVIEVLPGEFTEAPFSIPNYVYITGRDPWNSAVLKTSDLANDFITVDPNGGMFNIAVSGPTTAGKSTVKQVASGTTKLYWINIKEGYYGVTLAPVSGTARCHCIGVVTDGPTTMNRMFNCDNPAGVGVFILMQSGPMVTTWAGTNPAAVYLNSNGLTPPRANATLDLCQFRGNAPAGQTLYDVYADNGALVRGICVSFAGATSLTNTRIAICNGPNPGTTYKTRIDIHGSQIKPGGYTKDYKVYDATTVNSYSGMATEANLDIAPGTQFNATFADSSFGQVVYGELYVGNTYNKTPISSYVEADKSTGVVSGGGLSRGAGAREVDVAAGVGFLDTANGLKEVTWGATTVTINANAEKARIYIDSAGAVQVSYTGIDKTLNCQLGEAGTDSDTITYLFDQKVILPQFRPKLYEYLEKVIGPINISGGTVSENTTDRKLDVTDSTFFVTEDENDTVGGSAVTFNYWYRNGVGGWTVAENQDTISNSQYDDGSGTLASIPAGKFVRHLLMVGKNAGGTEYHAVYGQELTDTAVEAVNNPLVPAVFTEHACRLAAIVVQQGVSAIDTIVDQRPKLGQMASGSSGITNHNDMAGRDAANAHTQYQLTSEKGSANGYPSLGADSKIPSAQLPAIPHGDLGGGTLHSDATGSTSGFMSAGDKNKLDGVASGATANSTDAALINRANHTGEQAISTVTGLQNALDSKIVGTRQTCVKTADYAMSSVTPTAVPEMVFNLEANSRYSFEFFLTYRSAATGTGISFSCNGPAGPATLAVMKTIPTSATAAAITTANAYNVHQPSATTTAAGADQYAKMEGVIVTGATAGQFTLGVSSESNGTAITVRTGSMGFLEKL